MSAPRTELQVGVPSEPVDGVVCSSIIKLLYDIVNRVRKVIGLAGSALLNCDK